MGGPPGNWTFRSIRPWRQITRRLYGMCRSTSTHGSTPPFCQLVPAQQQTDERERRTTSPERVWAIPTRARGGRAGAHGASIGRNPKPVHASVDRRQTQRSVEWLVRVVGLRKRVVSDESDESDEQRSIRAARERNGPCSFRRVSFVPFSFYYHGKKQTLRTYARPSHTPT